MPYIIDTSTIKDLHDLVFPIGSSAAFWNWLATRCHAQEVQLPFKVRDELSGKEDELKVWAMSLNPEAFVPPRVIGPAIGTVLNAYSNDGVIPSGDAAALERKADPYVIAAALALRGTVITEERSAPGATRVLRKKIPDICAWLQVRCTLMSRLLWDYRGTLPS